MSRGAAGEGRSQGSTFTERGMLSIGGFALATAVVLASAYSPLLETADTASPSLHGVTHGAMFLAMAAFYLVMSRVGARRDALVRSRAARPAFLLAELLLPCAVLAEDFAGLFLGWPVVLALWMLLGIACAYFTCAWIDALNALGEERIRRVNLWSFTAAGIVTAAVLALPGPTNVAVFLLMCAASAALLPQAADGQAAAEERDEQWFAENSRYNASGSYAMMIDGAAIGVFAGLLVARASKGVIPPALIGIALICVAAVFFAFDRKAPQALALGRSQLIFLPLMACGLMLAGFLREPWNTVVALPLFTLMYLFDYTNALSLSVRGCLLSVSPSFCFSKGRVFLTLGQAIGWFVGGFIASEMGDGAMPVVAAAIIVLMCAYVSLAMVRPNKYPIALDATFDAVAPKTEDAEANTPPPEPVAVERPYKRKCAQAVTTYDLTPREGEILFYLAKGRNAKHIAEKLFVAERTVKTHTYHIYQKMGIHSQQELMDIIENVEE